MFECHNKKIIKTKTNIQIFFLDCFGFFVLVINDDQLPQHIIFYLNSLIFHLNQQLNELSGQSRGACLHAIFTFNQVKMISLRSKSGKWQLFMSVLGFLSADGG